MDKSKYKIYLYSRNSLLDDLAEDIDENTMLDAVVEFNRRWYKEKASEGDESFHAEETRKGYKKSLRKDGAVFVLIQDTETQTMVGYAQMLKINNKPFLGLAYVLPEYRQQGIYNELIDTRIAAATRLGYRELYVEPSGDAERVLRRKGFLPEHMESRTFIKRMGKPRQGTPEGMTPQSRL